MITGSLLPDRHDDPLQRIRGAIEVSPEHSLLFDRPRFTIVHPENPLVSLTLAVPMVTLVKLSPNLYIIIIGTTIQAL